jgi:hypothetical protein
MQSINDNNDDYRSLRMVWAGYTKGTWKNEKSYEKIYS